MGRRFAPQAKSRAAGFFAHAPALWPCFCLRRSRPGLLFALDRLDRLLDRLNFNLSTVFPLLFKGLSRLDRLDRLFPGFYMQSPRGNPGLKASTRARITVNHLSNLSNL